jgi:hypothetical protein
VTIEVSSGAAARWPNLYIKLDRAVCADCNNGWMSEMEQAVQPFLGPMLLNEHGVELDAHQQMNLARWAIIKILLLELSMRQQHSRRRTNLGYSPSSAELAWLATNSDPPPRSRVWLGAFDAGGQVATSTQAMLLTADGGPHGRLPSHVTTMTLGYVLMQVFSIDYVIADAQRLPALDASLPSPIDQALVRIWPTAHQVVRWPPPAYVDQATFAQVVIWARHARRFTVGNH